MKRIFGKKGSSSHLRFDGKVAVITGAASGIGAATARAFVSQGGKVILADVQAEAGKKISSELGSYAHFIHCDVTKETDVAAAVDYAISSWGRLDMMFNNAGVAGPQAALPDVNVNEFDAVMAVHVKGAVLGVKHAARVMVPAGRGVILFSGSTAAEMGGAGPAVYSAAKAAVLSIVRSSAAELGRHGIRVNAVSPHCVATPMSISTFESSTKMNLTVDQFEKVLGAGSELAGQVLTVEQVASAVLFLASEDAGFISGHNLVLDGGFSVTKLFNPATLKAAVQKSVQAERKAEAESRQKEERESNGKLGGSNLKKEREKEDKAREKEEKEREKEDKVAQKWIKEKEKERVKEEKEREKREKERLLQEEKARAKEEKARAKEEKRQKKLESKSETKSPEPLDMILKSPKKKGSPNSLIWGEDPTKRPDNNSLKSVK